MELKSATTPKPGALETKRSNLLWPTSWDGQPPDVRCLVPTFGAGGSERVCLRLCNAWAEAGKRVEVVIFGRHEAEFLGEVDRRVRVISLEVRRARQAFRPLVTHLRGQDPAPMLVFGFAQAMLLGIARGLRLLHHPLIYREGSMPKSNVPRSQWWLYGPLLRRFDAVVAQSDYAARELADLGVRGVRLHIISNPLPAGTWLQGVRTPRADPLRLLAVGRLSLEKGFLRLITGFARVRALFPQATLTILGEGGQRTALAEQIGKLGVSDSVRLAGFTPNVHEWLLQTDVVLAASVYEGQPNALMEALAAGCRVVTIDSGGGTREMMQRCGLADYVVGTETFEEHLGPALVAAMAAPETLWEEARAQLKTMAHVDVVQAAYFSACLGAALTR